MYRFVIQLFGFIFIPYVTVFAASSEGSYSSNGSSSFVFFQVIFYLALVLLLIYLFFWFMAKKRTFTTGNLYKHLGGLPLGQNKSVQILEIGGKVYILGVGDNIQLLHLIEDDEEIADIYQAAKLRESKELHLLDWFKELKGRRKPNSTGLFELELTEKIEQFKDRRIQSVNEIFDESYEGVEKRGQHE